MLVFFVFFFVFFVFSSWRISSSAALEPRALPRDVGRRERRGSGRRAAARCPSAAGGRRVQDP
jgi:hypothetical protein